MKKHHNIKAIFKDGILRGIAWSIGVTIGFALVSTVLISIVNLGGGLPVVGNFIANIVEATQTSLILRSR